MDSLKLYHDICHRQVRGFGPLYRLKYVEEIVQCIMGELLANNFNITQSSFLYEVIRQVNYYDNFRRWAGSSSVDIYVIMGTLEKKMRNPDVVGLAREYSELEKGLFCNRYFNEDSFIVPIKETIRNIQNCNANIEKNNVKNTVNNVQDNDAVRNNKEGLSGVKEETLVESEEALGRNENPSDIKEEKLVENKDILVSNEQPSGSAEEPQHEINVQIPQDNLMEMYNKRVIERSENCKTNVQLWHEENTFIKDTLRLIQPEVRDVLDKVMHFSDEITENYVLQFAKMQINLYNLIADNLKYHIKTANSSNNKDYYNAVVNYREYMEMICDDLSAFGVEEIASEVGLPFDGNIHEVIDNSNFDPKLARVKESVRAGFKYNNIIIQKEKIIV